MTIQQKHKGALAELKASAWLLNKGYEVFRNVSQFGPVDIIAMDPVTKELILIDVKTKHPLHKEGLVRKADQKPGVHLLYHEPGEDSYLLVTPAS